MMILCQIFAGMPPEWSDTSGPETGEFPVYR